MNEESVISWNLPNVVTVIMMLLIIWVVLGGLGHFLFRGRNMAQATVAPTVLDPQVLGV